MAHSSTIVRRYLPNPRERDLMIFLSTSSEDALSFPKNEERGDAESCDVELVEEILQNRTDSVDKTSKKFSNRPSEDPCDTRERYHWRIRPHVRKKRLNPFPINSVLDSTCLCFIIFVFRRILSVSLFIIRESCSDSVDLCLSSERLVRSCREASNAPLFDGRPKC